MYIDFHIHAFVDEIAERAIHRLETVANLEGHTRGTISETIEKLKEWGTDKGVLLPIATKPAQQATINDWASDIQNKYDRIISFGSVHPDAEDVLEELERVKTLGLKGIKFHPDYQDFFVDDEKMFPIYKKCAELELPVIFHAGFDPLSPNTVHCLPEASLKVHEKVPEMTLILAHMGGMYHWDDVEKLLVGKNIYFDTAFVSGNISDEQANRIIKNHGADKILLASDCPWHKTTDEIEMIERLDLSDDDKQMIFYKNAKRLLKL